MAFGSHTELLSQDLEDSILFVVQTTFVFTSYKILQKITSRSKQEGLAKGKRMDRFLMGFLGLFVLYLIGLMILKAEIFRHPNQSPNS